MRLRITEPGYENLTGMFGTVDFVDGVSVQPLSPVELKRLSAVVRVETVETGEDPSAATELQNSHPHQVGLVLAAEVASKIHGEPKVEKPAPKLDYTVTDLESIADEKGIAGLRVIGDQFGLRARSIPELIEKIIAAQATAAKPASNEPSTEAPAADASDADEPKGE
jgi:hypothetical protein